MTAEGLTVGIVGGGIGGLNAALSLLAAGFDVHVYEQAPALSEVGAGIQVSPNASRVLHRHGLAGALARAGVKPLAWHQRRWDDGRTLLRTPLAEPLEAAFGYPHYQIHRADLLAALAGAVPADALPPARRPPAAAARPADGLRLHRLVTRRRRLDLPARPRGRGPASGRGQTMSGVTR
jgi:salicylate hydroxylase